MLRSSVSSKTNTKKEWQSSEKNKWSNRLPSRWLKKSRSGSWIRSTILRGILRRRSLLRSKKFLNMKSGYSSRSLERKSYLIPWWAQRIFWIKPSRWFNQRKNTVLRISEYFLTTIIWTRSCRVLWNCKKVNKRRLNYSVVHLNKLTPELVC